MMGREVNTEEKKFLLYFLKPGSYDPRHPRAATSALVTSGLRTTMLPWKPRAPEL